MTAAVFVKMIKENSNIVSFSVHFDEISGMISLYLSFKKSNVLVENLLKMFGVLDLCYQFACTLSEHASVVYTTH